MEMNVIDPNTTLEIEIGKLEGMFFQIAKDKETTGIHPDGWPDPLPTKVISYVPI
jgi:hypothetical protein